MNKQGVQSMNFKGSTLLAMAGALALVVGTAACGGGGGGSSSSTSGTISVSPIDGKLLGATVICNNMNGGSSSTSVQTSATTGTATFPSSVTSCASLKVTGGTDASTNQPFTGTLKTPAVSSASSSQSIYPTPLSTLVTAAMAGGQTAAQAETEIKTLLGLPTTANLMTSNPYTSKDATTFKAMNVVAQLMKENTAVVTSSAGASASANDAVKQGVFELSANALYKSLSTNTDTKQKFQEVISSATADTTKVSTVMGEMAKQTVTILASSTNDSSSAAVVQAIKTADAGVNNTFVVGNATATTTLQNNLDTVAKSLASKVVNIADQVEANKAIITNATSESSVTTSLATNVDIAIKKQEQATQTVATLLTQVSSKMTDSTAGGAIGTLSAGFTTFADANKVATCTTNCATGTSTTISNTVETTLATALQGLGVSAADSAKYVNNLQETLDGTNYFQLNSTNAFTVQEGSSNLSLTGTPSFSSGILTLGTVQLSGLNLANLASGTGTATPPILKTTLAKLQGVTGTLPVNVTLELMDVKNATTANTYTRENGERYIKLAYSMQLKSDGSTANLTAPSSSATATYCETNDATCKLIALANVTEDVNLLSTDSNPTITVKVGNLITKDIALKAAWSGVNVRNGSFAYTIKIEGIGFDLRDGTGTDDTHKVSQIRGTFTTN
nr:uncharacterized protein [uncultured bacterium]